MSLRMARFPPGLKIAKRVNSMSEKKEVRKVLIVDDAQENVLLAKRFLQTQNIESEVAMNGTEALDILSRTAFDCILLDISMPGLSGEEVCQRIRANPQISRTRILAYTAHAMPSEIERFKTVGFDEIVIKPVRLADLLKAIKG